MSSDRPLRRPPPRAATAALALAVAAGAGGLGDAAAQVVTDGSLGAAVSLDGPLVRIDPALGRQAGPNLFHSFSDFGVRAGQAVVFDAAPGTDTVISRVTGGRASRIDGVLDAAGGAAVWLINPAGIDIGPAAQLRPRGGAFLAAADTVLHGDGARFIADAAAPLTLSAAAPVAFGFTDAAPGRLTVDRTGLRILGAGLALAGGEVVLDGAEVLGVDAAPLTLAAGGPGDVLTVGAAPATTPTGGTLTITGGQLLNVTTRPDAGGAPDGRVAVALSGGAVTLRDGAQVGGIATGPAASGAVTLRGGAVTFTTGGQLRSQTQGPGASGPITVSGFDTLTIGRDGAAANTGIESDATVAASGAAGNVRISGETALARRDGRIFSSTRGAGAAGAVTIDVGTLTLDGGGQVGAGALDEPGSAGLATGAGGRVTITARNAVAAVGVGEQTLPGTSVLQPSGVFTSTEGVALNAGPAGAILVSAPDIRVADGAEISSESFNPAPAGSVTLRPGRSLTVEGGAEVTSRSGAGPAGLGPGGGDGGRIDVVTDGVIALRTGGQIVTTVDLGAGRAGEVALRAAEIVSEGGIIASDARDGAAGAVRLFADRVALSGGGAVTTVTRGAGAGGVVAIEAAETILSGDARLATDSLASGDGGDVVIRGRALTVAGPAVRVTAESTAAAAGAAGAAGDILFEVAEFTARDGATISTASAASTGGSILGRVGDLALLDAGALTTSVAAGAGDGGDITLDAGFIVLRDGGVIRANAVAGDGGDITLTAGAVIVEPGSVIEAISVSGDDGAVQVVGAATAPTAELQPPPADFFDSFALIDDSCVAAITGGSALTLSPPETSVRADAAAGLFGGAIAYPALTPAQGVGTIPGAGAAGCPQVMAR